MRYAFLFFTMVLLVSGCVNQGEASEGGISIFVEDTVTNFEECIEAGNPAMESHPRQCRHKEQTFVEEIE